MTSFELTIKVTNIMQQWTPDIKLTNQTSQKKKSCKLIDQEYFPAQPKIV